jgi:Caspase domain
MHKLCLVLSLVTAFTAMARAEPLIFHASTSGQKTLDEGEGGGNPFASSLIEILAQPEIRLAKLPEALRTLTVKKSGGLQTPDVPSTAFPKEWKLVPPQPGEKRIALVLVVSDYGRAGANSLPGAEYDARRIASALTAAGFATETVLNLNLGRMREKLDEFAAKSSGYDAAAIYTTGHGLEEEGTVYLTPGDYPIGQGKAALRTNALPLREIAAAARARRVNLVFYGGCRNNPF